MSNTNGTIQNGNYVIKNVSSGSLATLRDNNNGSNLIASKDSDSENVKWTISKQGNNQYKLMSYVHGTYAWVGNSPSSGDKVVARSDAHEWTIKETGQKGVYLIHPSSDDSLYWGLTNSNQDTVIKLDSGNDDKNKWNFQRM